MIKVDQPGHSRGASGCSREAWLKWIGNMSNLQGLAGLTYFIWNILLNDTVIQNHVNFLPLNCYHFDSGAPHVACCSCPGRCNRNEVRSLVCFAGSMQPEAAYIIWQAGSSLKLIVYPPIPSISPSLLHLARSLSLSIYIFIYIHIYIYMISTYCC